jgi:TRAP-type C4-dicarboxylate transport system permease small subunit
MFDTDSIMPVIFAGIFIIALAWLWSWYTATHSKEDVSNATD